ncbi:MAG: hypothetical protein VR64_21300 [Desulfatitalea sp. BRH_c12]|nr:MAG: hypothetical protein VR64_21300 [Desulfatitalea sp. BRH_c12]
MPLPLKLISGKSLMLKWNMSHTEILFMVINHGLRIAYRPAPMPGIDAEPLPIDQTLKDLIGYDGKMIHGKKSASEFHFYRPDVDRIETEYSHSFDNREVTFTVAQISERWSLTRFEAEDLINQEEIDPVDPIGQPMDYVEIREHLSGLDYIPDDDLLYREKDILELETKYPELVDKSKQLPEPILALLKKAKPEIERVWRRIKKIGFGRDVTASESDYMKAAINEIEHDPSVYKLLSKDMINDKTLYTFTFGQEKRDFVGRVLRNLIETYYPDTGVIGGQKLYRHYNQLTD